MDALEPTSKSGMGAVHRPAERMQTAERIQIFDRLSMLSRTYQ